MALKKRKECHRDLALCSYRAIKDPGAIINWLLFIGIQIRYSGPIDTHVKLNYNHGWERIPLRISQSQPWHVLAMTTYRVVWSVLYSILTLAWSRLSEIVVGPYFYMTRRFVTNGNYSVSRTHGALVIDQPTYIRSLAIHVRKWGRVQVV